MSGALVGEQGLVLERKAKQMEQQNYWVYVTRFMGGDAIVVAPGDPDPDPESWAPYCAYGTRGDAEAEAARLMGHENQA